MTRSDLIGRLARRNPSLTEGDFDRIVRAIFETISQRLADGGSVELRGFGSFSTRARHSRTGRNPRTGDTIEVPPRRAMVFRPGKDIREMGIRLYASDASALGDASHGAIVS
jgi:integration host factor subunit beta